MECTTFRDNDLGFACGQYWCSYRLILVGDWFWGPLNSTKVSPKATSTLHQKSWRWWTSTHIFKESTFATYYNSQIFPWNQLCNLLWWSPKLQHIEEWHLWNHVNVYRLKTSSTQKPRGCIKYLTPFLFGRSEMPTSPAKRTTLPQQVWADVFSFFSVSEATKTIQEKKQCNMPLGLHLNKWIYRYLMCFAGIPIYTESTSGLFVVHSVSMNILFHFEQNMWWNKL